MGVPCGDTRRAAAAESFPVRSGKRPERGWKKAAETGLGKIREAGLGKSGRGGIEKQADPLPSDLKAGAGLGNARNGIEKSRGGIGKRRERD